MARALDAMGMENGSFLARSDNKGIIGAFGNGRGRNFWVNHAVRRVEVIGMATNVSYVLMYVESALNKADPFSRGKLGPPEKQFPYSIILPPELTTYISHFQ